MAAAVAARQKGLNGMKSPSSDKRPRKSAVFHRDSLLGAQFELNRKSAVFVDE